MAGQGTAALEFLEEVPDLDTIVTPVGGGGLLAGSAVAARALRPGIRVVGVETEAANDAQQSLRRGERVTIAPPDTIADGIRVTSLGALTWPVIQGLVDEIVTVSEEEVRAAMRFLLLRLKLVVEPTGAVPAAALLAGKLGHLGGGARIGVILSGGNVAPEVLCEALLGG
jgi:threonine dehydratase